MIHLKNLQNKLLRAYKKKKISLIQPFFTSLVKYNLRLNIKLIENKIILYQKYTTIFYFKSFLI